MLSPAAVPGYMIRDTGQGQGMADLKALEALVREGRGAPISRLGYFCAPFRAGPGPFAGKVIKIYRGSRDLAQMERLATAHSDYLEVLQACGVTMPETAFHLLEMDGGWVPVVVQEGLPDASMMRPQMLEADLPGALALMEEAGQCIATFWTRVQGDPRRIGFHPSIRNFAIIDGRAVFFDSFPPLIDYSRDEMGRMLLLFSEKRLMRVVGPLLMRRVTGIQDEWYSPPETLVGLVGSACRLRPDDRAAFLDWGRDFVVREMAPWADAALEGLARPPQLPGYWTTFRKLLGLQGEPNVG
ncbi:DUF6206 family protein [Mesobacterium pallidum]|uniref:DUF6206 family protein n=1 Tax=Mesobacterium pallidum TaxID=2872037 RepID=UPI00300C0DA6